MSLRKLKHHEKLLLKKVSFVEWKTDQNVREAEVMRRYHVQSREDYQKYKRIVGKVRQLVARLIKLDARDPYRAKLSSSLLTKLYNMGLIPTQKSLAVVDKVSASSLCRRRLAVCMVRLKMGPSVKACVKTIEQGHVRVGPDTVTDPAFLVTRALEDHVTWVDSSKIRRTIAKYDDKVDDFVLLGC
jgi:U3 small nucleolar ribonucleoprotein protein IMP3